MKTAVIYVYIVLDDFRWIFTYFQYFIIIINLICDPKVKLQTIYNCKNNKILKALHIYKAIKLWFKKNYWIKRNKYV